MRTSGRRARKGRTRPCVPSDNDDTKRLRARVEWLSSWHGRAAEAQHAGAAPAGEIPFALVDFRHPNLTAVSEDLGDHLLTLSAFGHLLRHEQVRFTGDPKLVQLAGDLAGDIAPDRRIARSDASTVRLTTIDRDASAYADIPAGTWAIVYDWFVKPLAGRHFDIPMNANLRPIFVSVHTTVAALKAPGAIDYLRRYAPIGCLDWDTVFLLHAQVSRVLHRRADRHRWARCPRAEGQRRAGVRQHRTGRIG